MIFTKLFKRTRMPADLPGAIMPGEVIDRFPLLRDLPTLIGLDLRLLTADKLEEMAIPLPELLDGTAYSGRALVHPNYLVYAEKGEDVNGFPFWVVDVFFRNVTIEFMRDLHQPGARVWRAVHLLRRGKVHQLRPGGSEREKGGEPEVLAEPNAGWMGAEEVRVVGA